MKLSLFQASAQPRRARPALLLVLGLLGSQISLSAQGTPDTRSDFDRDGKADIAWRNRITGRCSIWYLDALRPRANKPPKDILWNGVPLENPPDPTVSPDNWWRIVGTGKVNADTVPDLIWQHMGQGRTAVWFMSGADGNIVQGTTIDYTLAPGWRLVGVANFDGDGDMEILWENVSQSSWPVGQKAFWNMSSGWVFQSSILPSDTQLPDTPTGWKTVGIGDYGRAISATQVDPIRDGKPDLVLQRTSDGVVAIWYMDGLNYVAGFLTHSSSGSATAAPADFRMVGNQDFTASPAGGPGDGYTDILWRRVDFCDTIAWTMQGKLLGGSAWAGPPCPNGGTTCWQVPFGDPGISGYSPDPIWRKWYDQQQKMAGEELPNPTARVASVPDPQELRAVVTPSAYTLTWKLPPNGDGSVANYKISYKKSEVTQWSVIANLQQNSSTYNPTYSGTHLGGQPIDPGQRYDFNVTRWHYSYPYLYHIGAAQTTAASSARAVENRGGVLLLVDQSLQNAYLAEMSQTVGVLAKWLKGDGWQVYVDYAPRHTDDYSQSGFAVNYNQLAAIKSKIQNWYTTKAVRTLIIIGHVVVPFSGNAVNPDSHGVRAGPADAFYGDLDGVWSDSSPTAAGPPPPGVPPTIHPEEWQYGAGDGRMDQNFFPKNAALVYNGLELAVGRVDFARMTTLPGAYYTTSAPSLNEVTRISQYFQKTRKYRFCEPPYPLPGTGMAWVHSPFFSVNPVVARFRTLLNYNPGTIVSGNSLIQQSAPYLLGYLGGRGDVTSGIVAYGIANNPRLVHTAGDFIDPAKVPKIGFHFIHCSYQWDWNLDTSFLKSLLLPADYGLAAVWTANFDWKVEGASLGDHFGNVLRKNSQSVTPFRNESSLPASVRDTAFTTGPDGTFMAILGDPTLRLYFLRPPSGMVLNGSTLSWTASTEPGLPGEVKYLVYRKNNATEVYERIAACASGPLSGTSASVTSTELQTPYSFMVRTVKTITTGAGGHQTLSQGAFYPAL